MQFSYLAVPLSLIALAAALPSPSIEEITGEVNHFVDGLENVKITGLSKTGIIALSTNTLKDKIPF
ncbi:hypothetical protein SLS57_005668 [Botryosphaeria dothidea]